MAVFSMIIISISVAFFNEELSMILYTLQIFLFLYYFFYKGFIRQLKSYGILVICALLMLVTTLTNGVIKNTLSMQIVWRTIRITITPLLGVAFAFYTNEKTRRKLYFFIFIIMVSAVFYGLYQQSAGIGWGYNSRMDSYFKHPIVYASMLLIAFWMVPYLFATSLIRWLSYGLIIIGLYTTQSRSSWIALLLTNLLRLFGLRKNSIKRVSLVRNILVLAIVIVLVMSEGFEIYSNQIIGRFSGTMGTASASQRLGALGYIVNLSITKFNLLALFFGHGTGATGEAMLLTTIDIEGFAAADNLYVTVFYDYGITVLIALIWMLYNTVKVLISEKKNTEKLFLGISILGVFISSFFYEMFGWLSISTVTLFFVGIYLHVSKQKQIQSHQ